MNLRCAPIFLLPLLCLFSFVFFLTKQTAKAGLQREKEREKEREGKGRIGVNLHDNGNTPSLLSAFSVGVSVSLLVSFLFCSVSFPSFLDSVAVFYMCIFGFCESVWLKIHVLCLVLFRGECCARVCADCLFFVRVGKRFLVTMDLHLATVRPEQKD